MFVSRKFFIAILALAIVTEEVAGHKLLLGAAHIAKKVVLAKLHLVRPIARTLAVKKVIAAKLIGVKALIGAKVGLGALAVKHVTSGLTGGVAKKQTVAYAGAANIAPVLPVLPVFPAFRSALNFPEINVPVRFSVGGSQPAIRSGVSGGKTRESTKV